MTPIDYAALAERLKEHAALHDSLAAHSDEQRQWADDLRTLEAMVRGMAQAKPIAWLVTGGRLYEDAACTSYAIAEKRRRNRDDGAQVVPLFTYPTPQPQPQPQHTHADGCWTWGPRHYECALREIDRLHSAPQPIPGDWQLVPKEPTPEMLRAVDDEDDKYLARGRACLAYQAMLAAAPQPAPQPQPEPVMAVQLDVARNAVEHVGMANYAGRQREAESWLREAEFEAFTHPALQPRPERQPVSEQTDRCKHGVRFPHECRECEAEPSIEKIQRWRESEGLTEREPQPEPIDPHMIAAEDRYPDEPTDAQHPDDAAVDRFAAAMKAKLAEKRAEGRGGWDDPEQCSTTYLATLLRGHVAKGDPLDVGNFAMMLWNRGGATNEAIDVGIPDLRPTEAQIEAAAKWLDHHLPPEIPACSNRTALAVGVLRAAFAAKEPK